MSLIGDIVSRLVQPIIDAIKRALGPFGKALDLISKFFTGFRDSFNKGLALSQAIITEINEWRNFKQNINVQQRVINLPAAIDHTQDLLDQIKAAWFAIVDLAKQIKKQAQGQTEDPTAEAEEAVSDIESSGVKTILEKFPKLAKGLEKLLGFLAVAVGVLETIQSSIDDLANIVAAIRGIREEIETGSTIFLSQSNPRKTVTLEDGTTMKIRVGNLHS
jgi:hypothetical protein